MNRLYKIAYATTLIVFFATTMMASTVGTLTTFTSGTAISSADMNANFAAVANAVNDNQAQINAHSTSIGNNTAAIGTNTTNIGNNAAAIATHTTNIGTNTTNIGNNATAIGTKVGKAGDTMTGALTVPSITYSTPRAASVSYTGSAFTPESNTTVYSTSTNGILYYTVGTFYHSVDLPAGVTIRQIHVRNFDGTATGYLSADLIRNYWPTGSSTIATAATTPADNLSTNTASSPLISHVVLPPPINNYFIKVYISESSGSLGIYNVSVDYTYTAP